MNTEQKHLTSSREAANDPLPEDLLAIAMTLADDAQFNGYTQSALDIARALQAERLRAQKETAERCVALLEEGYDMPVSVPYRNDGVASKHDRCEHGATMYEDCMECAIQAIRSEFGVEAGNG